MAIKDLPATFFVDFYTLVEQSNNYISAISTQNAGPKPLASKGEKVAFKFGSNNSGLVKFWTTYIVPYNPKNVDVVKDTGTFDKKYKDTATWQNNFFTIRTQMLGAGLPGIVMNIFDGLWTSYSSAKGSWYIVKPEPKGRKN